MKTLLVLNAAPYGDERIYNGLRLAHALHKHDPEGEVIIFLMADAVMGAKAGQSTPSGYYNIEHMLGRVLSGKRARAVVRNLHECSRPHGRRTSGRGHTQYDG